MPNVPWNSPQGIRGWAESIAKIVFPTPKDAALGYGWSCPYCRVKQDEGHATGVYYFGKPVCGMCAPLLQAVRQVRLQPAEPLPHTEDMTPGSSIFRVSSETTAVVGENPTLGSKL